MSNSRLLRATAALFVCATCPLLAATRSHAAWESLGPDSPAEAYSLVVDPTDPDVAYVGGRSDGFHRN
jgi:hypothetical protein